MLPEVDVLAGRAAAHRTVLEELLDAIPADYWGRAAPGDAWDIRAHLAHVATADRLVLELLDAVIDGAHEVWLAGAEDAATLERRRTEPMQSTDGLEVGRLREMMAESRDATLRLLARIDLQALEATVLVAGVVDAWGRPWRWSLREYLAGWATHDSAHAAAIREAMLTPPDLSTVMLTKRKQRGG